ncbi:MAG: XrtA/PEP-CTERM system histidine kinase PrsK [Betaproteobacteria bacterium]
MDKSAVYLLVWSYGLAALGYGAFTLYLQFSRHLWQAGNRAVSMFVAVFFSAVWGATGWAFGMFGQPFFLGSAMLADTLRYAGWCFFILYLIQPLTVETPTKQNSNIPWLKQAAIALLAARGILDLLLLSGLSGVEAVSRLELVLSVAVAVAGLMMVEQLYRNASSDSRWNVKPLCLGLAGAFLFDFYLYSEALLFNRLDPDAFGIRGLIHALVIPLLLMSTVRSHDWVSHIRLSQKVAFHSATLVTAGGYLLFMASVGYYVRYFGGEWGRALQIALAFAALLILVVLFFSGAMRAKLRVLVGKHFFSYRYDYREEWLRFTQTLSAQSSPQAMGQQVIRGLADLLESPAGGLWLKDGDSGTFRQFARWNMPAVIEQQMGDSGLCQFMEQSGWVVNLEEYRCYPLRYHEMDIPAWLSNLPNAWLVVPLEVGTEMIGFVVLASPRTRVEVNWEVNDLLKTAGRQAASFLALMQATEKLLEVRKFDAFNRMSAFVVHDLKNIVTQLSLMLRNAERHSQNPEFQRDMLSTVEHAVERMRQLMVQLREGATPPGTPVGVDLARMVRSIQAAKARQGREVEVHVTEPVISRGHEERLERVIDHLVQNALDATDPGGRVWVKLEKRGGAAAVEVGDTGHGMSAEFLRERLFKPFQTTKSAGMGIGAYESSQYVRELGGKLEVESEENLGTKVTMLLPLFYLEAGSDLQQEAA